MNVEVKFNLSLFYSIILKNLCLTSKQKLLELLACFLDMKEEET